MSAKKKTAAPVEEQPEAQGVAVENTALAGISDQLAAVQAEKGLNLRTGPAASYAVLEVLPAGTVVAVLALPEGLTAPGWTPVHTGQRAGWVRSEYLQELIEEG